MNSTIKTKQRFYPKNFNGSLLERIRLSRGVEGEPELSKLLHFSELLNSRKAAKILVDAILNKKKIIVSGDYIEYNSNSCTSCNRLYLLI